MTEPARRPAGRTRPARRPRLDPAVRAERLGATRSERRAAPAGVHARARRRPAAPPPGWGPTGWGTTAAPGSGQPYPVSSSPTSTPQGWGPPHLRAGCAARLGPPALDRECRRLGAARRGRPGRRAAPAAGVRPRPGRLRRTGWGPPPSSGPGAPRRLGSPPPGHGARVGWHAGAFGAAAHRRPTPAAEAGRAGARHAVRRRAPGRAAGHLRARPSGRWWRGSRRSWSSLLVICFGVAFGNDGGAWASGAFTVLGVLAGGGGDRHRSARPAADPRGRRRPRRCGSPAAGWRWPGSAAARRGRCSACWAWVWRCFSP